MAKRIDTIVEDIYETLDKGMDDVPSHLLDNLVNGIRSAVHTSLTDRETRATLRMSNIGTPCNRKLYYTVNNPEDKELLPPEARMKFLYGHLLEELLLFLAELSGHEVSGRQDEQEIEGIKGHRDAVIDGTLVDVKSASTFSFAKFQTGTLGQNDPFGYVDQLQSYLHAGQTDDTIKDKDRAAFLVVDKTLGKICLDVHKRKDEDLTRVYQYKKELVARDEPPARHYEPEPEGKSGNMKLGMNCSYCEFKKKCWPGLRGFAYSNKPIYLTTVKKEPNVPEFEV